VSVIVEAHAAKSGGGSRFEHVVELEPGLRYRVRPVTPADEPALIRLLERMTPEEVRMRFFCCMRHFGHALVGPLTQLDDAQRIGLVAVPDRTAADNVVADAMLISEPDGERAEFAILVHRAHAQHGLGRHLLECLIAQGQARGVRQVYGIVLAENHKMLVLAAEMGFVRRANPDEPGTVRVELDLPIASAAA
jgi:GNAT superfamily N-acetyltransferase